MDRGSCVRCEEQEGYIQDSTPDNNISTPDYYCSTCWVFLHRLCDSCHDNVGMYNLTPMKKNNYSDETGFYCERCIA